MANYRCQTWGSKKWRLRDQKENGKCTNVPNHRNYAGPSIPFYTQSCTFYSLHLSSSSMHLSYHIADATAPISLHLLHLVFDSMRVGNQNKLGEKLARARCDLSTLSSTWGI